MTLDSILLRNFAIALFIGALVGIEREKRKESQRQGGIGGLRTFILFAEAGAIAAWMSVTQGTTLIFVGAGILVTALVIAGYVFHARAHPEEYGLTTEVAAVVVFLLGGAVLFGHAEAAVALAIVTSALLAFKQPLHGVVGMLGTDDIYAGLKLLIATFIVLPLLPDRAVDPWGALNPYKLWWLVILISSLSLVGYVAVRWLGREKGTSLTGLFGGLASSTAVTLAFARRSREEPSLADPLASGILLAWSVMFGRILVEVAVVNRDLLPRIAMPMAAMGLAALLIAFLHYRKGLGARRDAPPGDEVPVRNPFNLTRAATFGAFFAAVLLVVKAVETFAGGGSGLYVVAALAGLTDVDAITLSMANFARGGGEPEIAVGAITLAAATNTLVKCGMILALGTPPLKARMLVGTGSVLAVGAVVLVVT